MEGASKDALDIEMASKVYEYKYISSLKFVFIWLVQRKYTLSELESKRGEGGRIKELESEQISVDEFKKKGERGLDGQLRLNEEKFKEYTAKMEEEVSHILTH